VGAPPVVVINQAAAEKFFPGASPIGRRFMVGRREVEIVGIAATARYRSLRTPPEPSFYDAYGQRAGAMPGLEKMLGYSGPGRMHVVLRASGSVATLAQAIPAAVNDVEPDLVPTNIKTQTDQIDDSIARERMFTRLLVIFGAFGVLLTCIGLHGVTSYSVARRTSEIGIRVALGARRAQVLWLILRQVLVVALAGLVIGVPIALALGPVVASLLFGLAPRDVVTIAAAVAALLVVAIAAGWLPARRAARLEVVSALRQE
jgi:ABC-type antimicrobial peptide transport system permease subunit